MSRRARAARRAWATWRARVRQPPSWEMSRLGISRRPGRGGVGAAWAPRSAATRSATTPAAPNARKGIRIRVSEGVADGVSARVRRLRLERRRRNAAGPTPKGRRTPPEGARRGVGPLWGTSPPAGTPENLSQLVTRPRLTRSDLNARKGIRIRVSEGVADGVSARVRRLRLERRRRNAAGPTPKGRRTPPEGARRGVGPLWGTSPPAGTPENLSQLVTRPRFTR